LTVLWFGLCLLAATPCIAGGGSAKSLPDPVVNPHSAEICMNSRLSYHGGWSAAGTQQMLGDVLHATALAPVTGASRTIYAATSENVYLYDAGSHSLTVHKAGDWRSDATAAFEIGIAAASTVDAGAAMHLGQLESVALWTGTSSQLASCPRASAVTYANNNWNLTDPVDIVTSYGIRSVAGFTDVLVAVSSDGSLLDPETDGAVFLDTALEPLAYGSTFSAEDLSPREMSQLLWASYGCSNHRAAGSKGGLVCASAVANYYLTKRIYWVGADGVDRYHDRRPPGTDLTTRDHRIERVTTGDVRLALRQAVGGLPDAPDYEIICVGSTGAWPELEVGFAAMGAVLEASAIGLQGFVKAALTAEEQAAIRLATGIPTADLPIAVVSLGRASNVTDVGARERVEGDGFALAGGTSSGEEVALWYSLPADGPVELTVYDCQGRRVRGLTVVQSRGPHTAVWDCRDDDGRPVVSGVYFCWLKMGSKTRGAKAVVVR
jgi:hypothetical protein